MKKYLILLSLLFGILLVLIQSPFFTSTASTAGSTAKQPAQELDRLSPYLGSTTAQQTLEQNLARPTALAAADFDEDGTADLIAGYAGPSGGILTIHRGNVDAIYPNSPAAKQRKAAGSFTESPFIAPARVWELPEVPDFVATGDFDADGHWDVAMAANAGNSLYLLSGDGHGSLSSPKSFDLPGLVTALASGEINRADGLTDIAVAVEAEGSAQVLVFEGPEGALRSKPEVFPLPAAATGLVLGRLNEDYWFDLAAATGPAVVIIEGRDRKLSLDAALQSKVPEAIIKQQSLAFSVRSMSVGNFDGGAGADLALLATDGYLHLLTQPDQDGGKKGVGSAAGWSSQKISAVVEPGASQLITARVSSTGRDDLVIADSANNRLHIVTKEFRQQGLSAETMNVEGGAAAVLPMRLNSDALSDLVVLRGNQVAPSIVNSPQGPQLTFTVTNTNDTGAGSLRNAITLANQNPNPDLIDFNIAPGGAQTITPLTPLPTITDPVTIDGTTQPGFAGTPIIELNGSSAPNGTDGLLITGGVTTVRGLVINRFLNGDAIQFQTNGGNVVEGNFLGTNLSGNASDVVRVNRSGVFINGPPNNRIGGTSVAARNVISGNAQGISISGTSSLNTTGNLVQGNFIGTDVSGTADLGNSFPGVNLSRATATTIGGTVAGARNIISGNGNSGINFDASSGNLLQGNFIGTAVNGTSDLGNSQAGSLVTSTSANNTLGGSTPAARNIVSGNDTYGFQIRGAATNGNLVQGNFIGTDAQGTAAIGNSLDGVSIESSNNTIGGETAARNIISANGQNGISIFTDISSLTGVIVRNNYIGTDVNGTNCLGNVRDGVFVNRGSVAHKIAENLITCNGRNGVNIPNVPTNDPGVRIEVTDNSIFANGALGIDLGDPGITPNDDDDTDGGANLQQNFPVLTTFTPVAGSDNNLPLQPESAEATITVSATLNSTPSMMYTVHWYFSADSQCAMNQQGSRPLVTGRKSVNTDIEGNASFDFPFDFPAGITNGIINCTATDSQGNTSEFSACLPVTAAPAPNTVQFTSSTANVNETLNATTKVDLNVTRSGDTSGAATVNYASSDGTANDRSDYTTAAGTLRFAAGETTKTISVFIVDDRFGESAETFIVTLSNPVGLVLGSPASVTVTINSNESVDGGNPVRDPTFNTDFFVRQQYVDFLNREPDAPGLGFWKNQIDECETRAPAERQACRRDRRINGSAAFFLSIEFQETGLFVIRAQRTAFGRKSDTAASRFSYLEFTVDARQVGEGVVFGQPGVEQKLEENKQAYATQVATSTAFIARFPLSQPAAEYVDALFVSAMVTPTVAERDAAIAAFGVPSTAGRVAALRSVTDSNSVRQAEFNAAFVLMQYFGYLRRNPDASGYNFWLDKLNQFNGNFEDADMVESFITSGEYIRRFGPE
ncbi:MAG: Calx-beta domain-containing protein [Pyrinomonadaceae bacterium]